MKLTATGVATLLLTASAAYAQNGPAQTRLVPQGGAQLRVAQATPATPGQNAPPTTTELPTNTAAQTPDAPWAPPANFKEWASSIKFSGQVDAGIVGNPDSDNDLNFGHLFTDKANHPILNQLLLTLQRDTDPKATSYDFGFKLQGLYGSDARIVHSIGIFDHAVHDRLQLDIVEANLTAHLPWFFEGGIDVKGGIYPTPLGFELIDPKTNPFYTHSYIFNYGLPYKHLGLLSVSHVTPMVDVYLGIDTGTNVTIFEGDNNRRPGGIAGFGLNLFDGKLTAIALTHIGPENAKLNTPFGNDAMRYYNDAIVTYKPNDKLALTSEFNYVKEDGFRAEAYGVALYAGYSLTDELTLNGRAEVFRDNTNFFVSTPLGNLDYGNFERGLPSNFQFASRPTTYGALTAGVTYKPAAAVVGPLSNVAFRPELRYDRTLSNSKPYNVGQDKGQFTLAADVIIGF